MAEILPCTEPGCGQNFHSQEALLAHWHQECANKNGHLYCSRCVKLFTTLQACFLHHNQEHPTDQDISCPGCQKKFTRIGNWMAHIEKNICSGLRLSDLDARREKVIEFSRGLERLNKMAEQGFASDDAATADTDLMDVSGFNDYGRFLAGGPSASTLPSQDGYPAQVVSQPREHPVDGHAGDPHAGNPHPGDTESVWQTPLNHHEEDMTSYYSESPGAVSGINKHNINAKFGTVTNPNPGYGYEVKGGDENGTPPVLVLKHNPNSPGFNVKDYWCEMLGKFKCPHDKCWKSFKTELLFKNHLKSSAHTKEFRVQCPRCLRFFDDMTALVHHAESQGRRCGLRFSDNYRQFLSNVTGGLLDLAPDSHRDGTVKYVVPEIGQKAFPQKHGLGDRNKENIKEEIQRQKTFWDNKKPQW